MNTPRFDLYGPIHKGLRHFMHDTLWRVGHLDPQDDGERDETLAQLDSLLALLHSHVQHENDHVHSAIEARQRALQLGATVRGADTVALGIDELVNNAIEHGVDYRLRGLMLSVRLRIEGTGLAVEFIDPEMPANAVADLDDALSLAAQGAPSLENERGRGLFLLTVYLDGLCVAPADGGGMLLRGTIAGAMA